ncbi:MAG: hypothetical protein FWC99_02945 [Coriobacteriia bacterium]|nr:hypothetical protein [Coriobacteriia bacterium]
MSTARLKRYSKQAALTADGSVSCRFPGALLRLLCMRATFVLSLVVALAVTLLSATPAQGAFPELVSNFHVELARAQAAAKVGTLVTGDDPYADVVRAGATSHYTLTASNFVVHLDDVPNMDAVALSYASAYDDNNLSRQLTLAVKESNVRSAIGAYEVVLTIEGDNALTVDSYSEPSSETTSYPTATINVFVVDDRTTVEEGVVFYAHNFRKPFSDRAGLTAQSVLERTFARAYHVESGESLTKEIAVNQQELTDFIQCDKIDARTLSLSVPSTPTAASPELSSDEIARVMTTVLVTTIDNRSATVTPPVPPVVPPVAPDEGDIPVTLVPASGSNPNRTPGFSSRPATVQRTPITTEAAASTESTPVAESVEEEGEADQDPLIVSGNTGEADTAPPPVARQTNEAAVESEAGNGLILLAAIVVVVVLLGVGGFLLYQHLNKDKNLLNKDNELVQVV